ncbi:MAG: hypothetical protein ACR2J3_09580 [Aridibacter sp.]
MLLWLYLTAMVILIGGIVNAVGEKKEKGEEVKIESENEEEKEEAEK